MYHIVVNPASSSGHGKSQWDKIEPLFKKGGARYKIHYSSPYRPVEQICSELTSSGQDTDIVIIGGDGTMNAAVNGIRDFDHTRVGYIQTGSGNDLIHGLGLSKRDRKGAVEKILRGEVVRRCDIGRVTYHNRSSLIDPFTHKVTEEEDVKAYGGESGAQAEPFRLFNISAGIGFDAAVCRQSDASSFKNVLNQVHMGKLIYISEAVHMILTSPMVELKVTDSSGKETDYEKSLFAVAMNTGYEGGGFKFCPNADNTDGLLDLCAASGVTRADFFRIFPTAYNGNHLKFDGVYADRSASWRIRSEIPLWVHTDGEVYCKSSDITIDFLPQKLRLLI